MDITKGDWKIRRHGITYQIYIDRPEQKRVKEYEIAADIYNKSNACLMAAAPEMATAGQELDKAIGIAIMEIAGATKLSAAFIQIIQTAILPAQEKWRKVLAKAEGK